MASKNNIPLPPALKLRTGEIAANWKRFKSQWSNYELATDLTDESKEKRTAVLLTCIGSEAYDVFQSMVFTQEDHRKDIDEVIKAFDDYCIGETNVTYERYLLNKRVQEPNESFDAYMTELRRLVKSCDYGELEQSILKDKIVVGLRDDSTRRKLLQIRKLDLAGAIDICRASETATRHFKELRGPEEVSKVSSTPKPTGKKNPNHYRSKSHDRRQEHTEHGKDDKKLATRKCKYCAKVHEFKKELCSAYGKECKSCHKMNHFASVCKAKREAVRVCNDDDSDGESIFALHSSDNIQYKRKLFANLTVGHSEVRFQLDCGATVNILPERVAREALGHSLMIRPAEATLSMYDRSELRTVGMCTAVVIHPKTKEKFVLDFYITKTHDVPILGSEACQAMNFLTVNMENVLRLDYTPRSAALSVQDITAKFKDVFEGYGKLAGELHLVTDPSVQPVRMPLRKLPIPIRERVKVELDQMVKNGIITPVTEPSEWISALLVVAKSNGNIRICIDPKPLNKALLRNHYLMPTIDDILPQLKDAKVFSTCDARHGFWHVCLDEQSSKLTTFETPFGRFRWLRMPFGINVAPEEFQRRLHDALQGLDGIACIADDMLVYGCGETSQDATADHDRKMTNLLNRCRERGIRLNKEKFKLHRETVSFMGHLLTPQGLKPDPAKIEAIQAMPHPVDKKGVQRLIGMATYLAKFVPEFSEKTAPLRTLLDEKIEYHWNDSHDKAFGDIKRLLQCAPVLRYYDVKKHITVQCDASQHGLAACLLQEGLPVSYVSRALTTTEFSYAQIEKELLAIVFAMERFHSYVYGSEITVETDHKPLISITKKALTSAPRRLQRMLLRLQNYNFNLTFKPGTQVIIADTLSRAFPAKDVKSESQTFSEEIAAVNEDTRRSMTSSESDPINNHIVASATVQNIIRSAAISDEQYIALKAQIHAGWPKQKDVPDDLKQFHPFCDELTVDGNLIFKGDRLFVPESARQLMIERAHNSHIGINGCIRRAREAIFWPGMTAAITAYVSKCSVCEKWQSDTQKEPLMPHPAPLRPWAKVGVDLLELKQHTYLITVDYLSNYFEIDRLDGKKAKDVIYKMKQHFARHGLPDTCFSDNGPPFNSSEFRMFAKQYEFNHLTSSPRYPQSNGKVENAVKTAKRLLKKAIDAGTDPYLALLDWRNTPSETLKLSPVQIIFGRRTRTSMPTSTSLLKSSYAAETTERLQKAKATQAMYYDKQAKPRQSLSEGQTVRFKLDNKQPWEKAEIETVLPHRSYVVRTEDGAHYRRNSKHIRFSDEPACVDTSSEALTPSSAPPHLPSNDTHPVISAAADATANKMQPQFKTRSGRIIKMPARYRD